MAIKISNRARAVEASPTLAVASKAKKMIAKGIDVINFGVGEPDFNTPDYIKNAAISAINDNCTRYTPTPGTIALRKAICEKFYADNNITYKPEQVLVSPGAKASIYHILLTICDALDEVFIVAPYWVSYPQQIHLAGALPVVIPTAEENNFKLTAAALKKAVAKSYNPKALILNSPNNPTGTVYTRTELTEIARVCVDNEILIISDEIYEKLIYDDNEHISIASLGEDVYNNTVVINGVSKAYAMTGFRLGYAAGPLNIITQAGRIQGHTTSCVNSMSQRAALVALSEDDGSIEKMRKEFSARRKFLVEKLNKVENISCNMPKGAFYAMPNVSSYLLYNKKGIKTSTELALYLLENFHVALVPGSAFGCDNNLRFSYANSIEAIQKGLDRFTAGVYATLQK